ncbi:helix-turn-helix domain-containing protein [Melghirimyces profundicolus]|nr:transcriptional regulator [Melghirimyces profundicolus]
MERGNLTIGLGHNIRRRRKELKLTQAELADGIISVPYLSLIENEKARPKPDILNPLAKKLGLSVQDLMGVTDEDTLRKAESLIDKIRSSLVFESYDRAKTCLKELRELSARIADPGVLMKTDLIEINFFIHFFEEEAYRNQLKAFETRWDNLESNPNIWVWYLRIKGNIHFMKDQFDRALLYYKEAEKVLPQVTEELEKAYIYGNLGKTHLLLSDPSLGILYTEKSIEIMLRKDRWLEMCTLLNILGACYTHKGDYRKAILCFERVLRMSEQFTFSKVLVSRTFHELGVCHLKLNDFGQAIDYLHRSLEVVNPDQLPNWERGCVHQVLCHTYLKTRDMDRALHHVREAIQLLEGRERLRSECLIFLGQIHYHHGRYMDFTRCYREAIHSFLQLGTAEKVAHASHTLGKYYIDIGKTEEGVRFLLQAAEHYNQLVPCFDFDVELTSANPSPG